MSGRAAEGWYWMLTANSAIAISAAILYGDRRCVGVLLVKSFPHVRKQSSTLRWKIRLGRFLRVRWSREKSARMKPMNQALDEGRSRRPWRL
jgi:hypothetical protein